MAVLRERPYAQFNFLVEFGDGDSGSVEAGFTEVSGLDAHLDVIEYRVGNSKTSEPVKLTGLSRVADVTLKRGLIGSLKLWQWFTEVRAGDPNSVRNVTIHLLDEERTGPAVTWKLRNARPVRHVSGPLVATGSDIAIEELVLSYERLDVE